MTWAVRIFQPLCNLMLKSSCHLRETKSFLVQCPPSSWFIFFLPPWQRWPVFNESHPFPPNCCGNSCKGANHPGVYEVHPVPQNNCVVKCHPVPRLWFPDHIMISRSRSCLRTARSGWIKDMYFYFTHNTQKATSILSGGNGLRYFNNLFPYENIKLKLQEILVFLPVWANKRAFLRLLLLLGN